MPDDREVATQGNGSSSTTSRKSRPTKTLPTDRIQFTKQLDILRAYAAASGSAGKPVTNKEIADLVKMVESTVSMSNAFFGDAGFLMRTPSGIIPSQDVVNYFRAYEWNPETAAHKLAPTLRGTWFGQRLITKLRFNPMEEREAVENLAQEAAASKDYERQVATLLDYLDAAGIIARENGLVRPGPNASEGYVTRNEGAAPLSPTAEPTPAPGRGSSVATSFAVPTEGVVQFHVSVKVDMGEFKGWAPERISAFFGGIAQVLAAKGQIEQEGTGG